MPLHERLKTKLTSLKKQAKKNDIAHAVKVVHDTKKQRRREGGKIAKENYYLEGAIPKLTSFEKKKQRLARRYGSEHSGVIFIKDFPHGFYEKQMFEFFSQFGHIKKCRVSRSAKTRKSRGYAYIEFSDKDIALVAAEAMNGYMMFDHVIKCHVIPESKLPPKLWAPLKKGKKKITTVKGEKMKVNRKRSIDQEVRIMEKRLKTIRQLEQKLAEKGIEYKCEIVNLDLELLRQTRANRKQKASDNKIVEDTPVKEQDSMVKTMKSQRKKAQIPAQEDESFEKIKPKARPMKKLSGKKKLRKSGSSRPLMVAPLPTPDIVGSRRVKATSNRLPKPSIKKQ